MKSYLLLIVITLLYFTACVSPTPIESSWTAPVTVKDSTKLFQKILMVALLKDDAMRKLTEDKLVDEVKGRGVQSYKFFNSYDYKSSESVLNEKLQREGFDGIVIMRLAAQDKSSNYAPNNYPNSYNSWYGYYSDSYPRYSDPDYFAPGSVYHIETNVYSIEGNKLMWTGITTAVNTSDTNKMINGVIAAIREKMKKQGLIK